MLREAVEKIMPIEGDVILDFVGISLLTQSSADEFIGRIVREHANWANHLRFVNCVQDVEDMLQWAANHANSVYEDHQPIPA